MTGGEDLGSAQEDRGGMWRRSWHVYREYREKSTLEILPFTFKIMAWTS
jgi:hypothetical protein